jgi:hypothetical protein
VPVLLPLQILRIRGKNPDGQPVFRQVSLSVSRQVWSRKMQVSMQTVWA